MNCTKMLIIFTTALLTSCATLVNGPREQVSISTNPPGAVVTNGEEFGITPTTFILERGNDYLFIVEKPGYAGTTIRLHHKLNNWAFGNIISFGIIGAGIDSATGAIWRLEPDTLKLKLVPRAQTTAQGFEKPLPFG